MATVIKTVATNNNSSDYHYDDGTVRHNVGSDGLSDEDRAEIQAMEDGFYAQYESFNPQRSSTHG